LSGVQALQQVAADGELIGVPIQQHTVELLDVGDHPQLGAELFHHRIPGLRGNGGRAGGVLHIRLERAQVLGEIVVDVANALPLEAHQRAQLFAGLSKRVDLKLVRRLEFGSGAVALRYAPRR
jgi:hypothetical protein